MHEGGGDRTADGSGGGFKTKSIREGRGVTGLRGVRGEEIGLQVDGGRGYRNEDKRARGLEVIELKVDAGREGSGGTRTESGWVGGGGGEGRKVDGRIKGGQRDISQRNLLKRTDMNPTAME